MLLNEWMQGVDEKCNDIVYAFAELYSYTDSLETAIPGMTKESVEEAIAVVMVKTARMQANILDDMAAYDEENPVLVAQGLVH
jgi:hypothetical protein